MAVMNPHSQELGKKLCEALGLPKNTVWFELRCAVDEIVTVKCAYHPEAGSGEPLEAVLAEYEVAKRPEPIRRQSAVTFDAWLKGVRETAHKAYIESHQELSRMDARLFCHG